MNTSLFAKTIIAIYSLDTLFLLYALTAVDLRKAMDIQFGNPFVLFLFVFTPLLVKYCVKSDAVIPFEAFVVTVLFGIAIFLSVLALLQMAKKGKTAVKAED